MKFTIISSKDGDDIIKEFVTADSLDDIKNYYKDYNYYYVYRGFQTRYPLKGKVLSK